MEYWIRAHESYVIITGINLCTSTALHDTLLEVFFEKGKQRLSMYQLHRCRGDYFKMYKVKPLHVLKICGYLGSLHPCANLA